MCNEETPHLTQLTNQPFSAIIGRVLLTDVVKIEELLLSGATINQLTLEERAFGDYARGKSRRDGITIARRDSLDLYTKP